MNQTKIEVEIPGRKITLKSDGTYDKKYYVSLTKNGRQIRDTFLATYEEVEKLMRRYRK